MSAATVVVAVLAFAAGYAARHLRLWHRLDDALFDWIEASDDGPWWRKVVAVPVMWVRAPSTVVFTVRWWFGWRPPRRPVRATGTTTFAVRGKGAA